MVAAAISSHDGIFSVDRKSLIVRILMNIAPALAFGLNSYFSTIVTDIRERRFIADPVTGLAFAMGYFDHDGSVAQMSNTLDGKMTDVPSTFRQPFSFIIGEVFKIKDKKIRQIEAVLMAVPYGMESGW
jgi:hypothetical protein